MVVRASTVEMHHFFRSRRGYDRIEVDAVMTRIAETLRYYEAHVAELEAYRQQSADPEATLARTLTAAGLDPETKDARRVAMELRRQAWRTSTELLDASTTEAAAITAEAQATAADLIADAKALVTDFLTEAAESVEAARIECAVLLTDAIEEAQAAWERARHEGDQLVFSAEREAFGIVADAHAAANELSLDTSGNLDAAAAAVAEGLAEERRLQQRLAQLRAAVTDIEGEIVRLSSLARDGVQVIQARIDLEQGSLEALLENDS